MEFRTATLLLCYTLFLLAPIVKCKPPAPVIKCSHCVVSNVYGMFPDRSACRAEVVFPDSEDELLAAVAQAVQKKQKMRVVTRYSNSFPKLVCPAGESGLIISTRYLNHVVRVDTQSMRMTFESGVTLEDLVHAAAKEELALPHSPSWLGVTLGGMLGTGSHGSSLFDKGSAVHEYVVGMRLVVPASEDEGYAKVMSFTEKNTDLDALKVSLGVLGVISQVTLQLQPMFKRSVTIHETDDVDLESRIEKFGSEHEFAAVTWYPAMKKVLYRKDDREPISSDGNGVNDFIGFQSSSKKELEAIALAESMAEGFNYDDRKCLLAKSEFDKMHRSGTGLKNDGEKFTGYPVIGYQNKMQSSGSCLRSSGDTSCPWDPQIEGMRFFEIGISISIAKIGQFLSDVKKLRDMVSAKSLCGVEVYNGFHMRYVKASSAYLGKQEDSVEIEMKYYRAKDPRTPRLYEDVFEEVEQMALMKYGGLPHWGKNRNLAFDGVMKKYNKYNYNAFLEVKNKYDPEGLFSNEWTDAVLEIRQASVIIKKDGCALEGLCVCSDDTHCAPDKGYFCESGRVYKEARVCRRKELKPEKEDNYHVVTIQTCRFYYELRERMSTSCSEFKSLA